MPFVLRFRKLPCLLTQPEPLLKATAGKRLVQSAKRILVQPVLMAFQPREARLPLHSGFMTLTLLSPTLCDSSGVARHDENNKVWKKKTHREVCKTHRFQTYPGPNISDW